MVIKKENCMRGKERGVKDVRTSFRKDFANKAF